MALRPPVPFEFLHPVSATDPRDEGNLRITGSALASLTMQAVGFAASILPGHRRSPVGLSITGRQALVNVPLDTVSRDKIPQT